VILEKVCDVMKMHNLLVTLACLMAASLGSSLAYADGNQPGGKGAGRGRPSPEQMQKIIAKFDTDGDGKLNETERQAAKAARGTGRPGGNIPGGKGPGGSDGPNPDLMKKVLEKFDMDGDGKLNAAERQAARAAKGTFGGTGGTPGQKKPPKK
jgi:hypothetical protein